ncbi:hypothetical protein [Pandoraea sp. ISTKB]|uniref:hypothetical protein n=1 Tax=Pandoraea sp. ISTKB TaxID=1586708 RepID=UPI000846FC51|nr:hypothetical protein [Pandoraea sp. ISTKB]
MAPSEVEAVIAANRLPELRENLKRLNRRAEKHGVQPFSLQVGEYGHTFLEDRSEGYGVHLRTVRVTLKGTAFALGDYTVMASLNHKDAQYFAAPGYAIPTRYLQCEPSCDHCSTQKRRTQTYLLADPSGDVKHVGSTCVEEFTGHRVEHALAATSMYTEFAALIDAMIGEEPEAGGRMQGPGFPTLPFLALVSQCIRKDGWVSSAQASANRENGASPTESTAKCALDALSKLQDPDDPAAMACLEPVDVQTATSALEHAREFYRALAEQNTMQDFDANMWATCRFDRVSEKQIGLAAFVVRKYINEVVQPARDRSRNSEYQGTVSQRSEFTLQLEKKIPLDGYFGERCLHIFSDLSGNKFTWVASRPTDLEVGKTYIGKGTVKKHEERHDVKQTVLSRLSATELTSPEPTSNVDESPSP